MILILNFIHIFVLLPTKHLVSLIIFCVVLSVDLLNLWNPFLLPIYVPLLITALQSGIQVILMIWSFLNQSSADGPNLLMVFLSCPIMIGCNPSPFSLFGVAYCEPILFQFRISLTINPSPWLDYSPFPTIPELGAILLSSLPFALTLTFVDVSLLTELLLSGIISLLLLLWALPLKSSNPISLKIWVIFFIFIMTDVLSDVRTSCVLIFNYQFFSLYFLLLSVIDPLLV